MPDATVDPGAVRFGDLFAEHSDRVWRSLYLFTGDRDVASDAVAEAFAQAIRRGDAVEHALPWVYQAAFRIAAGQLKERGRTGHAFEDAPYEMPEPAVELYSALARLSPKQRASTILHFRDGYSLAEIADIIGSSASAVGVHLHRARRRLRELLGDGDA